MRPLLHDLRLAGRRLRRTPGFAVLASVTLALGIGAHAALAGWADATFLRPLPVPEPERLVGVYETRGETLGETRDGGGFHPLSLPDFLDHRARTEVFSDLAAYYQGAPLVLGPIDPIGPIGTADGSPGEIAGAVVSPGYFSVLGLEPVRGRFFAPDEATPGAAPVAVVSHRFWRQRLGGRADALGSVLRLNDTAFTVVGVAPPGFRGVLEGRRPEVWMPTSMASVGYRWCDASDRDCTWMEMIGRLAPGRTLAEARSEMELLGRRVREAHPRPDGPDQRETGLAVAPLVGIHPASRPRALRMAGLLGSAVTLLLLVAAINLGGLLVARNLARRREIATRLAIGAGRWRVVRESLAETAWIAAAGGLGGLLIAAWLGRAVVGLLPGAGALDLAALPAVVGHGALLSLVAGLGVGLAAGLQSSRPDLAAAMTSRDAAGGSSGRRSRVLGTLLVAQVALSFVLLSSAGLLVRSLRNAEGLSSVDPARVATLRLRPRLIGAEPARARAFTREALERLEALPGVETATLGRLLPPWPGRDGSPTEPEVVEVGPRFFETFGFPLVRGRAIAPEDATGPAVAVVGRAFAQTLAQARFGERDPVGELLEVGDETFRVVGVVDDTAYRSAAQAAPAVVYVPYWRNPSRVDARVAVRTTGDAEELLGVLGRTVRSIDPAVPVTEIETLAERVDRLLGPTHAAERVIGASALLTLLLSGIGLYGLLSLAVAQGRRDIGIRLALGGSRPRVVGQVVRGALLLVALALALGVAAALAAARGLAHHLYEIGPRDPATLAAAVALFALVAAAAAWWPARRAARVDPAVTLREG